MMARGVLGNDPFKRGAAASRDPVNAAAEQPAPVPAPEPGSKQKAKVKAKGAAAPRAAEARAETKKGAAKAPSQPAKKVSSKAAAPAKSAGPEAAAPPRAAGAGRGKARSKASQKTPAQASGLRAAPEPPPVADAPTPPAGARDHDTVQDRTAEAPGLRPVPATRPDDRTSDHQTAATGESDDQASDHRSAAEDPWPDPAPAARDVSTSGTLRERAVTALALGRNVLAGAASSDTLSQLFGGASGVWRALRTGVGNAGPVELDAYGRDDALARELRPVAEFLYDRYFRVRVENADLLPEGPAILVANHSGALPLDGPVLHAAIARSRPELRQARWLVEDQVLTAPFLGTLLNRLGAVRACPENALRLLDEGRPIIVFPEGVQGIGKPFKERYRLMRFGRGGFVKIALRARAPIIPVAIVGAEESMPLLARLPAKLLGLPYLPITSPLPLPARWTIRFGEPLRVEDEPPGAENDIALVHRFNERTRESVQGMLAAMLEARQGVFS